MKPARYTADRLLLVIVINQFGMSELVLATVDEDR